MKIGEILYTATEKLQDFAVIYICDITQVHDFNRGRRLCLRAEPACMGVLPLQHADSDDLWAGVRVLWPVHDYILLLVASIVLRCAHKLTLYNAVSNTL